MALALSLGAIWVLHDPSGGWRIEVDSSAVALSAQPPPRQYQLFVGLTYPQPPDAEDLQALWRMEQALQRLPGVAQTHSVASVQVPRADGDEIDVAALVERQRRDPERAQTLWEDALADSFVRGRLVADDPRRLLLIIEAYGDTEQRQLEVTDHISDTIATILAAHPAVRWEITGSPLVTRTIGSLLLAHLGMVLPLALLFFSVLVWAAFRSVATVLFALLSIGVALLWTLASAAALGWKFSLVTVVIPPLVMAFCVAYSTHVIATYAEFGVLSKAIEELRAPFALTALTTTIGLLALAVNELPAIRQFAVLGAIGTLAAAGSVWLILPWLLAQLPRAPQLWPPVESRLMVWARRVAEIVIAHSRLVLVVGVVLLVLFLLGAGLVQPGARYIQDLPESHPVRQSYEAISRDFGGANSFAVHLAGAGQDAALMPEVLRSVERLQQWLDAQPGVGSTRSLVDYIKRIHQVMMGGDPADHRIPADPVLIKQLLLISGPEEMYAYTDRSFSSLTIQVSTPLVETGPLQTLFRALDAQFLTELPPGLRPSLEGNAVVLNQTITALTSGQLRSILIAALAIYLVLAILFASARMGLLALLPNILPVAAYFALLGFSGTPLGPTTALVACIVLGVSVDDTLHLLVRFSQRARECGSEDQAARDAIAQVIRPITLSTLALVGGFLVMTTSPFASQAAFGLFAGLTLLLAWAADLLIAPAVASRASVVTLWDVMRIDLGQAPQDTIPIMRGMSPRQARVLALSSHIQDFPAGGRIITQGDIGGDMFAVIHGELDVWVPQRNGERLTLARRGRGSIIGEAGFFRRARTANVEATTPARVLVLNLETTERIRRRQPRIAALLYRNLNLLQVENLVNTTEQMIAVTDGRPAASAPDRPQPGDAD